MKRYEYKQMSYQGWALESFISRLNKLGINGWHVVGIIPVGRSLDRVHTSGSAILERELRPQTLFKGKLISELDDEEYKEFQEAQLQPR